MWCSRSWVSPVSTKICEMGDANSWFEIENVATFRCSRKNMQEACIAYAISGLCSWKEETYVRGCWCHGDRALFEFNSLTQGWATFYTHIFTLPGSGLTSSAERLCPRNIILLLANSHLSLFKVRPSSRNLLNTWCSLVSCSIWSFPCTKMSSAWHTMPLQPSRICVILRWKYSGAEDIPNGSLLKQ